MLAKYASTYIHKLGQWCGIIAMFSWLIGCVMPVAHKPQRWAAFYGETSNWQQFEGLDVVVFDADKHPPIAPLKAAGTKVLAYISVAEIAGYRDFAEQFSTIPHFVIGHHERWKSDIVDIRNLEWQRHILNVQISAITAKGFDGIMIDTLDSALAKASEDPFRFSGTQDAAIDLIKQMRERLPRPYILMVNRGFDILNDIAPHIDIVLAESILVDASSNQWRYFPEEVYLSYVDKLQHLTQKNTHLSIFTLDYLRGTDMNIRQRTEIECVQRGHGFSAYVATMDLQQYYPTAAKHC